MGRWFSVRAGNFRPAAGNPQEADKRAWQVACQAMKGRRVRYLRTMHESSTFRHAMVTFLLERLPTVLGQWSAGVMGGAGLDHGWTGPNHWIGGLVERRLSDSSSFVLRLSGQWYDPIDRGVYRAATEQRWFSGDGDRAGAETIRRYGLALEVKMPVLSARCEGGYHRGAYVVAGLGWEHAHARARHRRGERRWDRSCGPERGDRADRPLDGASCSWLAVWDPLRIAVRRRWDRAGFRSLCGSSTGCSRGRSGCRWATGTASASDSEGCGPLRAP